MSQLINGSEKISGSLFHCLGIRFFGISFFQYSGIHLFRYPVG